MASLLWQVLSRAEADPPRFSADEIWPWFSESEGQSLLASLLHQVENATSVECDACAEGHVEEVKYARGVRTAPLRAYIYCPENGRVQVPLDRLKQWDVDIRGLTTGVASSLELAGTIEEIVSGRVWSLGKGTLAGRSREVFLARGIKWVDAPRVLGRCERLNAARAALVFVPGAEPQTDIWKGDPPFVVSMKIIAGLGSDGCLELDRDHLESLLSAGRRKTQAPSIVSFPTPAGTTWSEVRVTIAENNIRVEAGGTSKNSTFQKAGFEERRKKDVPDRLWKLLKLFAVHGGVLPFKIAETKARLNVKQYVSDLRDRLIAFIPGVDGDPISYDKNERAYKTAFKIWSEEGVKFPTPSDATWADVSISRTGPSGLRISVSASERFASPAYLEEGEGAGHHWETAEREGREERHYDLRTLRLADNQERPNRAGQALWDVLAGTGTVKRKGDDKGMLELGGVLSKLMEIKGPPFRFDAPAGKWVAIFDASGES